MGFASEVGLADLWFAAHLVRRAPVSREMIVNYVARLSATAASPRGSIRETLGVFGQLVGAVRDREPAAVELRAAGEDRAGGDPPGESERRRPGHRGDDAPMRARKSRAPMGARSSRCHSALSSAVERGSCSIVSS
jgi:hypothetical protein